MKYFTGLKDIVLLPNYCGYVNATYSYKSGGGWDQVLIAPSRGVNPTLLSQLRVSLAQFNQVRNLFFSIRLLIVLIR